MNSLNFNGNKKKNALGIYNVGPNKNGALSNKQLRKAAKLKQFEDCHSQRLGENMYHQMTPQEFLRQKNMVMLFDPDVNSPVSIWSLSMIDPEK